MGAQQSNARTLTVENEDPTLVIKVSDAVVDRLKGKLKVAQNETTAAVQRPSTQLPVSSDINPNNQQHTVYYPHLGMSSIQLLHEKEEQIRNNDQYWQGRINDMERGHKKMHNALEKEYEAAMSEIKQTFVNEPSKYQLPPCRDMGSKLMKCYQTNPGAPLKCSSVVQEFSQCVNVHRMQTLTAKAS